MRKKLLLMIAGCGLMLLGFIWLLGGSGAPGTSLFWLIFLACPLLHLFMGHGSHEPSPEAEKTEVPAPGSKSESDEQPQ